MITRLRVLYIEFENEIEPFELPAFRAAIAESAGKDHILFHNHKSNNQFLYNYPLIQYKFVRNKPVILCIEKGVDEIHHFFENKQEGLVLNGRPYDLKIDRLKMNQFNMQVWDKTFKYNIRNWLALNQKNYESYAKITSDIENTEFLEKILTGNILSFAKGIDWHLHKRAQVRIHEIVNKKIIRVKNVKREAFTLLFSTNVFLPDFIGLGKNASMGFGVIKEIKTKGNTK